VTGLGYVDVPGAVHGPTNQALLLQSDERLLSILSAGHAEAVGDFLEGRGAMDFDYLPMHEGENFELSVSRRVHAPKLRTERMLLAYSVELSKETDPI
jgi:hypothetical protein